MREATRACHRESMYVDFEKIYGKEHYIIAPVGYSAFYCHGTCTFPFSNSASNHALLQSYKNSVNSAVPAPCCAPTKLGKISMLYYDDNRDVKLKYLNNSVAEKCGCH